MSSLLSQRLAALAQKLKPAEHSGQYFSSDDVAGLIAALKSLQRDAAALEDRIAAERRGEPARPARPAQLAMPLAPMPLGTLMFVPAGAP
jgi:hypothetical protein